MAGGFIAVCMVAMVEKAALFPAAVLLGRYGSAATMQPGAAASTSPPRHPFTPGGVVFCAWGGSGDAMESADPPQRVPHRPPRRPACPVS